RKALRDSARSYRSGAHLGLRARRENPGIGWERQGDQTLGPTRPERALPAPDRPHEFCLRGGLLPEREDAVLGGHGQDDPLMGLGRHTIKSIPGPWPPTARLWPGRMRAGT